MSDQRRVRTLAAVLTVGACVVSGCTDPASKPKPLPSSSSSPASPSASPSASARPTAPPLPPEARGTTPKAAEAFSRHYVDLINYAMHSGDTAPLKGASARRCSGCAVIAKAIDDVYRKSGRVQGGGWSVLATTSRIDGGNTRVRMQVRINKQTVYERPGASPSTSHPNTGRLELALLHPSNHWAVQRLDAFT